MICPARSIKRSIKTKYGIKLCHLSSLRSREEIFSTFGKPWVHSQLMTPVCNSQSPRPSIIVSVIIVNSRGRCSKSSKRRAPSRIVWSCAASVLCQMTSCMEEGVRISTRVFMVTSLLRWRCFAFSIGMRWRRSFGYVACHSSPLHMLRSSPHRNYVRKPLSGDNLGTRILLPSLASAKIPSYSGTVSL